MQNKHFLFIFTIALGLVMILGVGCKKTDYDYNIKDSENSAEKQQETYKYKDISQIIGDVELAGKMEDAQPTDDNTKQEVKGSDRGMMMIKDDYQYSSSLEDVTGGGASGLARAGYENGGYSIYASFANLLEPANGDFYEGWLVRVKPFGYISTGKIEKIGGIYNNLYKSRKDFTKYDLYVLTLEPDDGNSAPATHILEGVLEKL
jgi:hypothetical protein